MANLLQQTAGMRTPTTFRDLHRLALGGEGYLIREGVVYPITSAQYVALPESAVVDTLFRLDPAEAEKAAAEQRWVLGSRS